VTGSAGEGPVVVEVVAAMRARGQSVAGQLSLSGLAGLLSRCRVVVSNDTGPLHLARAMGAATVGIYGAYNLIGYGPLTRLRHRALVSWQTEPRRCSRHPPGCTCRRCVSLVSDVGMEEVTVSALDLLLSPLSSG